MSHRVKAIVMFTVGSVGWLLSSGLQSAYGQEATPAPTSPAQRTYWPTTDIYDPALIIGRYAYITKDGQMGFATTARENSAVGIITTKFQNAAPSLKYDYDKKEDISAGVPGIASGEIKTGEFVHLEINDISETTIENAGADFCTDWLKLGIYETGIQGIRSFLLITS